MTQFSTLAPAMRRPRIVVVGDVMLDHDRIGDAHRLSPEAPVPVLVRARDEYRLGGAGAVAAMCSALGAETCLLGVLGDDRAGRKTLQLVDDCGISFIGEIVPTRPTTRKERICAVSHGRHRQQIVRIDEESVSPIETTTERALVETLAVVRDDPPDVLIASDYNKGVMTDALALACRDVCRCSLCDPPAGANWVKYRGYSCLVPNRMEAQGKTAAQLREELGTSAMIVKLDAEGCQCASTG